MQRKNFNQLPSSAELQNILATEAKRNVSKGKDYVHYVDFSPLIKLAKYFGIDTEVISNNYTPHDVTKQDLFAKGKIMIESLKNKLLNTDLSLKDIEICNIAYDYLAEEDTLENVDFIFVFGAKTPLRIKKAIELYQQGLSPKIIVSGRSPHYASDQSITEAENYALIAEQGGVPASAIIIENESISIPDNVRSSLNLLDEEGIFYKSIALVNSPYVQRRGWAHFKKYLPDTVKLVRVNCETSDQYKRDYWYKSSTGIDTILSEYLKAKIAVSLNTA